LTAYEFQGPYTFHYAGHSVDVIRLLRHQCFAARFLNNAQTQSE
jgi:hypothetical protein